MIKIFAFMNYSNLFCLFYFCLMNIFNLGTLACLLTDDVMAKPNQNSCILFQLSN